MNNEKICPQTPFDCLIIPREFQILKLLLPILPPSFQGTFGICIKFMELQYTIRYFQNPIHILRFSDRSSDASPFQGLTEKLSPYLDKEQADLLQNITSALQMAELFQASGDFSFEDLFSGDFFSGTPFSEDLFSGKGFSKDPFSQTDPQAYDNSKRPQEKENTYGDMDGPSGNGEAGSGETGASDAGLQADSGKIR